jgi:hypothetical protein
MALKYMCNIVMYTIYLQASCINATPVDSFRRADRVESKTSNIKIHTYNITPHTHSYVYLQSCNNKAGLEKCIIFPNASQVSTPHTSVVPEGLTFSSVVSGFSSSLNKEKAEF